MSAFGENMFTLHCIKQLKTEMYFNLRKRLTDKFKLNTFLISCNLGLTNLFLLAKCLNNIIDIIQYFHNILSSSLTVKLCL